MVETRVGGPMLVLLSRCLVRATSSALAAHSAPVGGVAYVPARCLFNGAACQAGAFSHRHDSSRPHHARRPISTTSPLSAATAVSTADTPSSSSSSPSPSSALKHGAGKSGVGVSGDPRVAKVFDDIRKPARDDRAYRMVWLRNGMQVLLASDPTTDMASASMNIHAGHFQDPPELPGLAHFHEHMLFLGTDKFPKEGEYEAFLNSHGGSSNAYTAMEDTNYYLSVKWDQLRGALDRFSAFYTCPRFDDSSTEREMRAVDSEHTNNRQDDGWRLYQLQKSLAHPDHPFHKFGSGNLETLKPRPEEGVDTREELLKFHETYYSADIMKLAVIGREPLDVLQSWVVDLFSDVRTTGQPSHYTYPVQAFGPSSLGIRLQVVPVRDTRRLSLAFPLPFNWEDQKAMQPSKPSRYISHLVGHEGPGSLYSLLNGKGWIESLSAGASMRTSDMEIFKVSVSLTPEGIKHLDEVTGLVFQFFKLLRDSPVRADLFDELKTMSETKFLFREKENAVDFASTASSLMQDYDAPSILWGPYQLQLDEADIRKYLSLLTPQHMQMTIVSKHLQEQAALEPESWRAEKWYGTLHKLERIDEGLLKQWADPPSLDPALSLPSPNPFMPHDFTIKSDLAPYRDLPPDDPVDPEAPVVIQSAPGVTVYHKLDRMFKVPKALFFAHLRSRHVYASPHSVIMQRLYSMVLREELNDFAYDAALAGLSYSVSARTTGLGIRVGGYSHKLPVLLDRVLQRSQSLVHDLKERGDTDQELLRKFEKHRDKLIREYTNFMEREAPYELALYHTRQALDAVCWHVGQYLSVLRAPECRPSVMASTVANNLARMDLDAFAHGNLEEKEASHLTGELTSALGFGPLFDGEEPDERTVELPAGSTVVFQADGPNPEEDNSAAEVHFQVGHMHVGSIEEDMLVDVVNHLAHTSAYQTLRTEKQLGYIVSTFSRRLNGVQGFSVVVQSPSASPTALEGHIEEWMVRFRGEMERMTPEEFQGHIQAIEAQKMEKDKRLSEEAHRHWSEIVERRFEFHRSVDEVEALRKLTLQKLINFWDSRLAAGAPERRKFASFVYSPKHAGEKLKANWEVTPTSSPLSAAAAAAGGEGDSNVIVIDTIDALRAYKRTRPLYPSVGR